MKQFISSIIQNIEIAKGYYQLNFHWDYEKIPKAGQFFTVKVNNSTSPLLRRPFAFSGFDINTNTASMIYQKRGQATQILAGKSCSDTFDIIGPLGNFFPEIMPTETPVLIAGGIGLGPLLYFAQELTKKNHAYHFIFGAPSKNLVPQQKWFCNTKAIICTDDGSEGFHGNPLSYIKTNLELKENHCLYACGPTGMLKAAAELASQKNLSSFSVMEQVMACGVGACMGCIVNHKDGYKRVCVDGPVFKSKDILWT